MDIKQLAASAIETIIKIVIVIFLVRFVVDTAVKAYDYGYRVFAEEPMTIGDGRTISIGIGPDDSVKDIGESLAEKGLIRDANLFLIQAILSERYSKIIPGIYDLNTSMSTDEMLDILTTEAAQEEEAESVSTDNVPIETTDDGDAENPDGTEGTEDMNGTGGADGTGGTDAAEAGTDGEAEPDAAGE